MLNPNEWGESDYLYGRRVQALMGVVGVMVRNFRPRGDDRVCCADRDGLYILEWNSRFDPHSQFILRTIRGDRVAQRVIGRDPPHRD